MKKIITVLFCLLILCGCSKKELMDGVSCDELGEGISESLSDGQEYMSFEDAQRDLYFDKASYDDFYHVYSVDTNNINEIGVFHAKDAKSAKVLTENCQSYIDDMRDGSRAFIASYAPEELPKLDGARVKCIGNYVIYTVLPEDSARGVLDDIQSMLEK